MPLEQMSVAEKLQVMEAIWDDLSRNANDLPAPAWHGDVLRSIEARIERGEETFDDWETAKQRIRSQSP